MSARRPEVVHPVVSVRPEGPVVGQSHPQGDGSDFEFNKCADNADRERPATPGETGIAPDDDLDEVGWAE